MAVDIGVTGRTDGELKWRDDGDKSCKPIDFAAIERQRIAERKAAFTESVGT